MPELRSQKTLESPVVSANIIAQTPGFAEPLVLIVEPDDESRLMLKTLLEMWSYRVIEARNADESVYLTEENCPDFILIDTTFQFIETLAIIGRLRRVAGCSRVPIIFLSGHAQPNVRDLVFALGANDLFVKPVDYDNLRKALRYQRRNNKNRSEEILGGFYQ